MTAFLLDFFSEFAHGLAHGVARRRAALGGVGVAHIQEAGKLQVCRKIEGAFDFSGVEAASPQGCKAEVGRLHHHRSRHDARIHVATHKIVVVGHGRIALVLVVADHEHHGGVVGHAGNAAKFGDGGLGLEYLHRHRLAIHGRRRKAARFEHEGEFFGFHSLVAELAAAVTILGEFDKFHGLPIKHTTQAK